MYRECTVPLFLFFIELYNLIQQETRAIWDGKVHLDFQDQMVQKVPGEVWVPSAKEAFQASKANKVLQELKVPREIMVQLPIKEIQGLPDLPDQPEDQVYKDLLVLQVPRDLMVQGVHKEIKDGLEILVLLVHLVP